MAYATFSSCSKSSIRQKPSVCISKFHWDNFWTKSGYIENTNQGFKDKNNQTWTIQRLFDNFTACFKKIIEPEPEKEKNISTPIFIANSVVSREWGQFPVIANIEWTNVEHILLFCKENRICFYKDKTFLDPSAVTCKQLYPFIPLIHEIRGCMVEGC